MSSGSPTGTGDGECMIALTYDTNLYLLAALFSDGGDLGFNAPVVFFIPYDDYRKLILRLTFQT